MNLQGKFAVVTGGGSGIGLTIVRALQAAGTEVLIVGRDQARLNTVRGGNTALTIFAADISKISERERLIQHLLDGGKPDDIFVNNAGTMQSIELQKSSAMAFLNDELALDLHAPIHFSTALLPHLLARPEAAIVNITTGLIYSPFGYTPGYSASKGGLHGFTRSLRWQTRASRSAGVGGDAPHGGYGPDEALRRAENPAGGSRKRCRKSPPERHNRASCGSGQGSLFHVQARSRGHLQNAQQCG